MTNMKCYFLSLFLFISFVTVGSIEDAEAVINHFNNTLSQRIKVSYSEKSAKDYNKPCTSNKDADDFYLSLFKDPRFDFLINFLYSLILHKCICFVLTFLLFLQIVFDFSQIIF